MKHKCVWLSYMIQVMVSWYMMNITGGTLMSSRADLAFLYYLLSYPPEGTQQLLKEVLHTVPWWAVGPWLTLRCSISYTDAILQVPQISAA